MQKHNINGASASCFVLSSQNGSGYYIFGGLEAFYSKRKQTNTLKMETYYQKEEIIIYMGTQIDFFKLKTGRNLLRIQ